MPSTIAHRQAPAATWAQQPRLRRADWRFLLPSPLNGTFAHLVLLGGPANLAARIEEIGLARRVSHNRLEHAADVLVLLHDSPIALDEALPCLQPNGALYYEVDRRERRSLRQTPRRVHHSLTSAGLVVTGVYWAKPNFDRCEMYLPLDAHHALRWYLATLYAAATPVRRLLEPVLQLLARFGSWRFASLAPCYGVTAVAGPHQRTAPFALEQPALPALLQQPDLRLLLLTGGTEDSNRVAALPFTPQSTQPVAVLKTARLPDHRLPMQQEQAILAYLHTRLDRSLRATIPQPYGLVRWGQHLVAVESCAPGQVLGARSSRWGVPLRRKLADLQPVSDWLARFHAQTQQQTMWDAAQVHRWIATPLADYQQRFGVTEQEKLLFAQLRARADALRGLPLPLVWQHHGFGDWNMYKNGEMLSVIDWEGGHVGLPLSDLLYFAIHWMGTLRRLGDDPTHQQGFRALFCTPHPTDSVAITVRAAIKHYVARLGIDQRFVPLLLVLTWVIRAASHTGAQHVEQGAARRGNRYVAYVGALAEHPQQLWGSEDIPCGS